MTTWGEQDLVVLGAATEVDVSARRRDGSSTSPTPIWLVQVGEELLVRSWRGAAGGWFRRAIDSRVGRVRAGGFEYRVEFADPEVATREQVDAAYREKYSRYGEAYVGPMTGDDAAATTLRLLPR